MSAKQKPAGKRKRSGAKSAAAAKSPATRPDEMSEDVLEFITAVDDYKRKHARPFPTWSEVLQVLKDLGYEKPARL